MADLIAGWRDGLINGTQLMRAIVSHPHWKVPVSPTGVSKSGDKLAIHELSLVRLRAGDNGVQRLMLWSSAATYAAYVEAAGKERHHEVRDTPGDWVFRLLLDDRVNELWIDPRNPEEIIYREEQFPRIRDFAAAVAIERDLAKLKAGVKSDGAMLRVRDYPAYLLPVAQSEAGQRRLVLIPGESASAPLAAVFTADDTFDTFLPQAKAASPDVEVQCVAVNGEQLFEMLTKMNISGVVFNCAGPATALQFASNVFQPDPAN